MYREILRNDFHAFIHRSFLELNYGPTFLPNWHLELLAAKLEDVRLGRTRRLIINLPPRYLKTLAATVAFPAWLLGHDPSAKLLCLGYAQDVSDKFARECKMLMMSPFYRALFETRLAEDRIANSDFATTAGGERFATSTGGVITSRGADYIIIDDPTKADDALSDVKRKSISEIYDNTIRSRLNYREKGAIVLVMQRLHTDDLVAHVQKSEEWELLSLPAIATEDERYVLRTPYGRRIIKRKLGEALQPSLESVATLENMRRGMSDYNFSAQFQQNPTPREGNRVKRAWFKYYNPGEQPTKFDWVVQSWDTANKATELNDYSVCTTWGIYKRQFYLLDVFRRRLIYPELKRAVIAMAEKFNPSKILIEDKASGTQLIQELGHDTHLPIRAFLPDGGSDKEIRLDVHSNEIANGNVFLPQDAPWLGDYVAELTGFPGMTHDDQVDSTTQFFEWWTNVGRKRDDARGTPFIVFGSDYSRDDYPSSFDNRRPLGRWSY